MLTNISFNAVWNHRLTTRINPAPHQTPHRGALLASAIALQSQHASLCLRQLYVSLVQVTFVFVNDWNARKM